MTRKLKLLLLLLSVSLAALGQSSTASLTGVVRDASGGVVPNATVRATNTGTNAEFQATSNTDGQYSIRAFFRALDRKATHLPGFKMAPWEVALVTDEVEAVDARRIGAGCGPAVGEIDTIDGQAL